MARSLQKAQKTALQGGTARSIGKEAQQNKDLVCPALRWVPGALQGTKNTENEKPVEEMNLLLLIASH